MTRKTTPCTFPGCEALVWDRKTHGETRHLCVKHKRLSKACPECGVRIDARHKACLAHRKVVGPARNTHCRCGAPLPTTGRTHGVCKACRLAQARKRWPVRLLRMKLREAADALIQAECSRLTLQARQGQAMGYSGRLGGNY